MADSNLNSSISALVSDLQNQIATASVTELLLITRAAKAIGHTENTAIEIAVNTRVNQLTSTATADELEKLARAVDNLTDTASAPAATTSISDHTDVDTTTTPPTDGQALVWDNSTALWKPEDVASDSYTDVLPDTTATYDLGSPSKTWVDVYAANIKGLDAPVNDTDAARKKYVDDLFASAVITVNSVNGYQGSVLLTTDDVDEGIYNLYYDDTKVDSHLNVSSATNGQTLIWNGTDYSWGTPAPGYTSSDFDTDFATKSTTDVVEGTNLYYTDARVQTKLGDVSGHIIPDTTETYDLGSATNKFRDLYLSGNSITLGTIELSDNGGALEVTSTGGGSTESFATETYVTNQVNNLIDAAPGTLDTLNELAAALGDDANFSTTITNSLANKADTSSLATVATSGSYNDLSNQPTIPTIDTSVTTVSSPTVNLDLNNSNFKIDLNANSTTVTTSNNPSTGLHEYTFEIKGNASQDTHNIQSNPSNAITNWRTAQQSSITGFTVGVSNYNAFAASPDGKYAVVYQAYSSSNKQLTVFKMSTPGDVTTATSHLVISNISVSAGGRTDQLGMRPSIYFLSDNVTINMFGKTYNAETGSNNNNGAGSHSPFYEFSNKGNWTPDGLHFYAPTGDPNFNKIKRWDATAPFDWSTASLVSTTTMTYQSNTVMTYYGPEKAIHVSGDGTKLIAVGKYISNNHSDYAIDTYTLSTPFDPASATYVGQYTVANGGAIHFGSFTNDGNTYMYSDDDRLKSFTNLATTPVLNTITWPNNFYWEGGSAPTATPNDESDIVRFATTDSGSTFNAWVEKDSDKSAGFDGQYSSLTGAPTLATVATSGSYNDLSNQPTIPTNNNQLTNGAGFITAADVSNSNVVEYNSSPNASVNDIVMLNSNGTVTPIEVTTYKTNKDVPQAQIIPNSTGWVYNQTNGAYDQSSDNAVLFPLGITNKYFFMGRDDSSGTAELSGAIVDWTGTSTNSGSWTTWNNPGWTYGTKYSGQSGFGGFARPAFSNKEKPFVLPSPLDANKFLLIQRVHDTEKVVAQIGTITGSTVAWSNHTELDIAIHWSSYVRHLYDPINSSSGNYAFYTVVNSNSSGTVRIVRGVWDGNTTITFGPGTSSGDHNGWQFPSDAIDPRSISFSKITANRCTAVNRTTGEVAIYDLSTTINSTTSTVTKGTAQPLSSFQWDGTDLAAHTSWSYNRDEFVVWWRTAGNTQDNNSIMQNYEVSSTNPVYPIAKGTNLNLANHIQFKNGDFEFISGSDTIFTTYLQEWIGLGGEHSHRAVISIDPSSGNLTTLDKDIAYSHNTGEPGVFTLANVNQAQFEGTISVDHFRKGQAVMTTPHYNNSTVWQIAGSPIVGTYVQSNIDATKIHGIAATSGGSPDVTVEGGIHTGLSGLTAGTTYFVLEDGTISATADNHNARLGIAMTSTSLAVDLVNELTNASLATYATKSYVASQVPSLTGYATETYVDTEIANLVDSSPATLDTLNELAAALGDDANFSTTITNQIAAKADAYSIVSVTTSSGNFYIDGEQQGIVTLQPGRTYRFDQSDASNNSHPLRFSEISDGTHGGGSEYTTGVTTNGTAGNAAAYVEFVVTNATPRLYYYCANHSGMGGKVSVGKEMFVERITSDTWITGPIQTTTLNLGTGGSINAALGTMDFSNSTVVFSGATVTGLSNSDVGLANIADNAAGVVVTGKVAAGSLDIGTSGSINAQLATLDFRDTLVNFSGADVGGLDDTIQDEVDFHLNKNNSSGATIISDGEILSWNATGGLQGTGDYEWITQSGGSGVEVSATAPSSPSDGDMWFDSTNLLMYVYYTDSGSSQWVQSGGSSGANAEITNSENPPSAPAEGQLWFDTSNLLLYVYYNDGTSSQWVQTSGFSSTSGLDVSDLTDTTNLLFDGQYSSLTGAPTLFDGQYSSLTGAPTLFDGQYSSLTGAPTSSTAGALGTLTKTFTQNEEAEITLSETISPVPNVSVFKEVPQGGSTSKGNWDVNANATNYDFYDEKPLNYNTTTLTPSATGDGTFTSSNPTVVGYDLSNPTYDSKSFSHNSEDSTEAQGLEINNDGTKMYIFGRTGSTYQYSLSTAYDASTASYDNVSFDMSPYNNSGSTGLRFNNDGTKVYTCGNSNDYVFQYSLSTAYDLSTASFTTEKYIGNQAATPQGVNFNNDGTRMYITNENGWIYQYPLSTPFLITSWGPSYDNTYTFNSSLTAKEMLFNDDGTKMYILHSGSTATIRTYSLSTAYDMSTVSYDNIEADLGFAIGAGSSFILNNNGSKIYVNDPTAKTIKQYSVGTEFVFNASDVGKKVVGNSGAAVITSAAGAYTSVTAFADTSVISSWQLFGAQGKSDGSGIELSGVQNGYDIANASYDNVSFSLQAQDAASAPQNTFTGPKSLRFNNDGTKMYFVAGNSLDHIFEYDLSTAWDLSSASYNNSNLVVTSQTSQPAGIDFSSDGTKLFLIDEDQDKIWKYNLSTAWDLSSASYSNNQTPGDILRNLDADPSGLVINSDGTRILWLGASNTRVYQMTLSTAYDLSTASMDTKLNGLDAAYLDVSALGTSMTDINISSDGKKLFLVNGYGTTGIYQYDLANPYEINDGSTNSNQGTASYNNISFSFPQDGRPSSVAFDTLGTKMYGVGMDNDTVYQYSTGEAATPYSQYIPTLTNSSNGQINSSSWVDLDSMVADETKNDGDVFYAVSTDDRTSWGVIKDGDGVRKIAKNNSGTWQYNNNAGSSTTVSTGFDLTNVTYDNKSFYFTLTGVMGGIEFKPDGTKLYVSDASSTTNGIRQYNLSTAWDISTAVHYGTGNPQSIANHIRISDDGTQVYYLSQSNDYLYSDILSTPWDITTISYNAGTSKAKLLSISISGLTENSPQGFDFADNGSKLYMVGQSNQYIYEWSLSTPWDISTASIGASDWHNISSQDQFPEELVVSADGTKILVSGNGNDKVFEYVMSTAFDITTATYTNRSMGITDSGATGDNPTGLALSADGMKLYYATSQEYVFQYSISGSGNAIGYGTSETWVDGTHNNEHATLQEALGAQSFNRMDKAQLQAVTDPNHYVLGDTLDLMIAPYAASGTSPLSDGVTIGYQAAALVKQAINGTDYEAEFPSTNKVKIKSLAAQNLKIRII